MALVVDFGNPLSVRGDVRSEMARTLDDQHEFHPPSSAVEWRERAARVREQILVAAGLWPMPKKEPLKPVIHGAVERDSYTVEKVFFESYPGFYVTGSLYRPKGEPTGGRPAVLCPHGHWRDGRFSERSDSAAHEQIALDKEKTLNGARYHLQARCAMLARMGCVVFFYDMVGYADSTQISHSSGFGDAEAELRLQSAFGLQMFNSIRALDFLASLPDVDPERIGVTGASGGGTQTFFLGAVDPRPRALFPAVMVSTGMQGGCVCENATLLRVGTDNVEFTALAAPRPVAMSGANDWTIDIETQGLPALKKLYGLIGAADHVHAKSFPAFEHNYNQVSRELMYNWFQTHLALPVPTPVTEVDFEPVPPAQLSVFNAEYPRPEESVDAVGVRAKLTELSDAAMEELVPTSGETVARYREVLRAALRAIVGSELPAKGDIEVRVASSRDVETFRIEWLDLARRGSGESIPTLWVVPEDWTGKVLVAVSDQGKGDFASSEGSGRLQDVGVAALVRGVALLAPDVFLIGDEPKGEAKAIAVDEQRHERYFGYTYGYNRTVIANRVHDILTSIGFALAQEATHSVYLVGVGHGGLWSMLAKGLAGADVRAVVAEVPDYRFADITDVNDPRLLPGGLKYGGWGAFASLSAPDALTLVGDGDGIPATLRQVYRSTGAEAQFHTVNDWSADVIAELVR